MTHEPADPGDFRFEITPIEEPEMGCTHLVVVIGDEGEEIERFTTDDPYGAVEAAREAQAFTLEERFAMYAERGW
jgi:hypothetical protein